jgi:hypothetical protein
MFCNNNVGVRLRRVGRLPEQHAGWHAICNDPFMVRSEVAKAENYQRL